jgi:hypothetical protein
MITFSAKELCTMSCMQIKMYAEHPERRPQPSAMVEYGEKFQRAVANTIPNIIGEEMRGKYTNNALGITINFSNDIVCDDKIIEVKSVHGKYETWYLQSSILQCAFYKSMVLLGARHLETASFYVNLGNKRVETDIDTSRCIRYILIFGEENYEIFVSDPYQIVGFFENKAINCGEWNSARRWDEMYKHHEYEALKQYIKYKSVF